MKTHLVTKSMKKQIADLNSAEIWSIRNPSDEMASYGVVRQYGSTTCLLSAKAADCLPEYGAGGGSVVIFRINNDGKYHYLLTADNKKYIMNCGGTKKIGESNIDCAIRKVREELEIDIVESQLVECAKWEFVYKNKLIGSESWAMTTVCYLIDADKNMLYADHPGGVKVHKVINDELEFVVTVSADAVAGFDGICGKSFGGHHKKLILDLCGIKNDIDVSYLNSFNVYFS